jgi:maltose alpha-D-glucosyltransferase/alpha-amylase
MPGGRILADVFQRSHSDSAVGGLHTIDLDAYGHRWFRVGGVDNSLERMAR